MKGYAVLRKGVHGFIETNVPEIGAKDALLEPVAVAPCSSDTHFMHTFEDETPRVLGHEAIGRIVRVGDEVIDFKPGDIVIVPGGTPDWGALGTQMNRGNPVHDHELMGGFKFLLMKDGTFAEYFHVNQADANLAHLPDNVSIEAALALTDMAPTGFYGAEMADIEFGDSVVVFGIGPVGLMAIAAARLRGAGRIYAVGTRPNCIELAKKYGATDIISYKEGDVAEQIIALETGQLDRAIIAGGNVDTFTQALRLVRPNGTIANVLYFSEEEVFNYPSYLWGLGMSDVTIKGGMCPGGRYRVEKLLKLIQSGRFDPSDIFNYKYHGFDKIEEAFTVMDEKPRDLIKPIVYIDTDK